MFCLFSSLSWCPVSLSSVVLSCLPFHLLFSFSAFFLCLSLSVSPCDVVWCVVCVVVVVVLLVVVVCVWCATHWKTVENPVCGFRHAPVCTFKTSPCAAAPCPPVFQHVRVVPVHTETFWTYTRPPLSSSNKPHTHTQKKKTKTKEKKKLPSVLLTKICPQRVITCPRGSPYKRRILAILRIGRAQSLNAPLLPVAIHLSYETRTLFRQGPPHDETATTRREHDTNKTTATREGGVTARITTGRQNDKNAIRNDDITTPHQPTQPTNNDARHTTWLGTTTQTCICTCKCMCLCTCRCLPSLWPSTMVECSQNGTTTSDAQSSVDAHQLKGKRASLRMPPTLVLSACQSVLLLNIFFLLSWFPT